MPRLHGTSARRCTMTTSTITSLKTIVWDDQTGSAADPAELTLPKGKAGLAIIIKVTGAGFGGPIGSLVVLPKGTDKIAGTTNDQLWLKTGDTALIFFHKPTKSWMH